MKNKLNELVRKIILGATAALTTTIHPAEKPMNREPELLGSATTVSNMNLYTEKPKLVLQKPGKLNFFTSLFHRSHRSHSSHSSHYSSYTNPKEDTKPTTKTENKTTKPVESTTIKNQMIYELGSRVLAIGMTGTDVAELQEILIKKGFKIKITAVFDQDTEGAVKKFQKTKDLAETGKVDVLTLYYIKNNE